MYRIGSLFTGYGGLEMGISAVINSEIAWCCDNDPAAAALAQHHHPETPNIGDITTVDWSQVEPVDMLAGGFPCTDVSSAGKRAGIRPSTRSGLWTHMACAVAKLRPALVVIENVRGLLSTDAHCDLEPCPWCLGDNEGRPLRALGAVLGDLASLGYVGRWHGLRASDVGAPHGRFRVFITAWPATDPERLRREPGRTAGSGEAPRWRPCGDLAGRDDEPAADSAGPGWRRYEPVHVGQHRGSEISAGQAEPGRCDSAAPDPDPDPDGVGPVRGGGTRGRRTGPADHGEFAPDASGAGCGPGSGLRGPAGTAAERNGAPTPTDTTSDGWRERWPELAGLVGGSDVALGGDGTSSARWGPYEPAIRRWELILGRPAPAPTKTGQRGGQQLSPQFVEWLMGLPEGWVTDVPGLSRNDQLKLLGNGVVPQQASAVLAMLLAVEERAA